MEAGIVIVGAGMAGHRAAVALRAAGYDGKLTLLGEETLPPYDRPPLSKAAITAPADLPPAWLIDAAAKLDADLRCGVAAERIDRDAKTVLLKGGGALPYDKLLLATGAKPRQPTCPGGARALLLRNYDDALALRSQFQAGRRIVIIGGGFIGLELAASAVGRGCRVTVIEAQPRILMRGVPEAIARLVQDRHQAAGVTLRTGTALSAIEPDAVHLADGATILYDAVVAGIGAAPETRLAEAAGLEISNGIAVDATLRTSDPDIFAAGDCCSFPHPLFDGARLRLEAWRNAQDQGTLVAENLLGAAKDYTSVPWFWSDQHDLSLQVAGLPGAATRIVERRPTPDSLVLFHLSDASRLVAVSGIGPGNAVARDVKLGEMLIARRATPDRDALAAPAVALKSLLKG
jgi:3-phenylpropionate/trans-cinnamate dioxygenase ferredoxin reductase subunit